MAMLCPDMSLSFSRLTRTIVAGCLMVVFILMGVVKANAQVTYDTTICSGSIINYTPPGAIAGTKYSWPTPSVVGGITGTSAASLRNSIDQTPVNGTAIAGTVTFTNVTSSTGPSFNLIVTVNPVAQIGTQTLAATCSGTTFAYTPTGVVPSGTTYAWNTPVITPSGGLTGGNAQSNQTLISQTLTSSNNIANTATYTVTPTSGGCAGNAFTVNVPVNPVPSVTNQTPTICSGSAFSVNPTVPSGTTYTWATPTSSPAGIVTGGSSATGLSSISQTLTSSATSSAHLLYNITPSSGACSGTAFTVDVTVNPQAQLSTTLTPSAICNNTTFNYPAASSTPGTTLQWTRAAISGISNAGSAGTNNPLEVLSNVTAGVITVTYVYTLTTPAGCPYTASVLVPVNPTPTFTSTLTPTAICSSTAFSYIPAANVSGTVFTWSRAAVTGIAPAAAATGTGNPNEILTNSTTNIIPVVYNYILTANSCSNTQSVTVNVNPIPSVANQSPPATCSNTAFLVSPTGVPTGTQYSWTAPVISPVGALSGGSAQSFQNSISQVLVNGTISSATASYSVTPIANGCSGSTFALTVTVKPTPAVSNQTLTPVCSGVAFGITPTGLPSGTTYSWASPVISPSGGLTGGSAQALQTYIGQTLNSTNNISNTAVYTVTPSTNGCDGNNFLVSININPVPSANNQIVTICSGSSFSAPLSSVPTGTTYSWPIPVNTPTSSVTGISAGAPGQTGISQLLNNITVSSAQSVYTVTPATTTCTGSAFTITVVVNPPAQLSTSLTPPAICNNTTFSYPAASNTSGTTFQWTRAVIAGISNAAGSGSTNNPLEILSNITAQPITVTYVYTLTTPANCTYTQSVNVVVNPSPVFTSSLTPTAICSSAVFSYLPVSNVTGTTFTWSRPTVTGITQVGTSGTGNPNEPLTNTTTSIIPVAYNYMLTANSCSNTQTVTVNVNPTPAVSNQTATPICGNTTFTVSPTGVPTGTTYTWTTPVSSPIGAVTGGTSASAQPSISQLVDNITTSNATLTYTVTPSANGCSGSTFTVAVTVKPTPVVSNQTLSPVCSGATFAYTPTGVPTGTTYSWGSPVISPSNGLTGGSAQALQASISQTLSSTNNIANTAVYTVTPSANSCAGNSFQVTVPVNPVPSISNQAVAICSGTAFSITPTPVPSGTTYTWTTPVNTPAGSVLGTSAAASAQTSISQTLTNTTFASAQSVYTVTPLAGTCTGPTFTVTVTVNPATQLSSSLTAPAICSNTSFSYTPTSNTASTTFQWTRAAVSGISNPAGAGTNDPLEVLSNVTTSSITVTYVYTLPTPAGCSNTQNVTVVVKPTPGFTSSLTPTAVCSSSTFSYIATANVSGTSFVWARPAVTGISNLAGSGTGNVNEILTNTTTSILPVVYNYTLTANGCSNTQSVTVNVNPLPAVSNQTPAAICGNTSFLVSPTGVPTGTQYTWTTPVSSPVGAVTGGSSATLQNSITQLLDNATTSNATLTYTVTPIANGCSGSNFTVAVTVKPTPVISNQTLTAVCSGTVFTYAPTGVPAGTTYSWGNPLISPANGLTGGSAQSLQTSISQTLSSTNNIANSAVYTVVPSANNCAGSSFQVTVPVNPVPAVTNQTVSICSGNTFSVTPTPVPSGTTYTWTTPVITPASSIIGTSAQPIAQTSISQTLTNNTFASAQAVYTVTPVSGTCTGPAFTITVGVNPGTQLSSSLTPPAICSNTTFSYTPTSGTPSTVFQWTRAVITGISNPAGAGTNNPLEVLSNITAQAITVTYVYTLTSPAGCTNTQSVNVLVKPTPSFTSLLAPPAVCSGTVFNYTPVSNVSGTTFAWSRPAVTFISNTAATGTGSIAETLVNTSTNAVDVSYNYTLTANGCSNSQAVTVSVSPTPVISNQVTTACNNVAFSYTPSGVPTGTVYTWTAPTITPVGSLTGGSAQASGQTTISQTLLNQTTSSAVARYTVTPSAGVCTGASFTLNVTVNPTAVIGNITITPVCSGSAFTYTPPTVPSGTTYTWDSPVLNPLNSLTGGTAEPLNKTSISQTLSSSNNLVNTAAYTVYPSTNGCLGNSFVVTVPVNPTPAINSLRDTICTGTSFSVVPSPVPANTTYTWPTPVSFPFGAITGGTAQASQSPSISQTLVNTTSNTGQVTYTVKPTANGCVGSNFTVTIVVGTSLANVPNQTTTVCSGTTFNATPASMPPGTTYTWGAPTVTPAGSVSGVSAMNTAQTAVSQTPVNLITNNSSVVYSVVARNTGCASNPFTATVTVLPVPQTFVTGNATICRYPFDTLTLTFAGQAPWGFTYLDNGIAKAISGITAAPYKLVIPSTTASSRTIAFYNASFNGCSNTTDTVYFSQNINPLPTGVINSLHGTYICNNILDTLFIVSPDAVSYQWTADGVSIAGITSDSVSTNIGARYNVIMTNQYGCVDTTATPYTLVYVPQPVLQVVYDTYCINTLMNFTNMTDTSQTGPITWLWSYDNGNTGNTYHGSNIFTTSGDHHIQLKATQQYCPATPTYLDATININFPIAGITLPSVSAYKGVSTPVSARTFPGYRYLWTPPFGINKPDSASTFFNYGNTQQYIINLISPAGCITYDSLLIRVFDNNTVDIFVPKSFTPNGDGVNDVLYPYIAGIKQFIYFRVFNRLNQPMFQTNNYDQGWNGMWNGVPQPMGIYIWVAVGIAADGSTVQKTGQVLLLR